MRDKADYRAANGSAGTGGRESLRFTKRRLRKPFSSGTPGAIPWQVVR